MLWANGFGSTNLGARPYDFSWCKMMQAPVKENASSVCMRLYVFVLLSLVAMNKVSFVQMYTLNEKVDIVHSHIKGIDLLWQWFACLASLAKYVPDPQTRLPREPWKRRISSDQGLYNFRRAQDESAGQKYCMKQTLTQIATRKRLQMLAQ